jgi:hypothetical protein
MNRGWCDCEDAPLEARGSLTLLDHDEECGFPEQRCTDAAHRMRVHDGCGRPVPMRFCACAPSGYTYDVDRAWWVHYQCGWPTKAWYTGAARPAPEHLLGLKPVTYHEYVPVTGKANLELLSSSARRRNKVASGGWVWD